VPSSVLPAFPLRALGAGGVWDYCADGRGAGVGAPPRVPDSQSCLHDAGGGGGGPSGDPRGVDYRRIFGRDAGTGSWRAAPAAAHLSAADYLGDVPWNEDEAAKTWYAQIKSRPSFRPILAETLAGIPPSETYADLDF